MTVTSFISSIRQITHLIPTARGADWRPVLSREELDGRLAAGHSLILAPRFAEDDPAGPPRRCFVLYRDEEVAMGMFAEYLEQSRLMPTRDPRVFAPGR